MVKIQNYYQNFFLKMARDRCWRPSGLYIQIDENHVPVRINSIYSVILFYIKVHVNIFHFTYIVEINIIVSFVTFKVLFIDVLQHGKAKRIDLCSGKTDQPVYLLTLQQKK